MILKFLMIVVVSWKSSEFALASPGGGHFSWPHVGPEVEEQEDRSAENIRSFRRDDAKIPPGSKCEEVLLIAEKRLGRSLTEAEINANLDAILKATGESLEQPEPQVKFIGCFTGQTMVSTPTGPRPIGELKVGDAVVSIDLATKKPVTNRIALVRKYENRRYSQLADQNPPINVTDQHPFYSEGNGMAADFRPISEIPSNANVFKVNPNAGPTGLLTPTPRGCYVQQAGTATVFDLSMEGEPRNFIVEGVLVHNKPIFPLF